jgi:hypothetical protein
MHSPTQVFFTELEELSFVDAEYKKRFIEELHDHIEDAIHDAGVRGVDDVSAEQAAIQKLGSPKKLQKNFNRMMKPNQLRTIFLLLLNWIGTYILLSIALIPFYGIAQTMVALFQRILGLSYNPESLLLPNISSLVVFIVIGILSLISLQTALFQSILSELLMTRMKRFKFWLVYSGVALVPWLCIILWGVLAMLIGDIPETPNLWLEQAISLGFLLAFVTLCFSLAALNVIFKLNGTSLWWLLVERVSGKKDNRLRRFFQEHHWLNLSNAIGLLFLLYLIFWGAIGLSDEIAKWYLKMVEVYVPGNEPTILSTLFMMLFIIINIIQTLVTSFLFNALSPITGVWVAGIFYSAIFLLCGIIISLRLWKWRSERKTRKSIWVPLWVGALCFMILFDILPNDELNQEIQITQWQKPQTALSTAMNKKIFGPFYLLYSSSSLFSPIPGSDIVIDFTDGQFVIESVMGSSFVLKDADIKSLYMTERQSATVIDRVSVELKGPIPNALDARVACGEKPLDKKADIQMDGGRAYQCDRIVIDGVEIVTSNYPLTLTDIAINDTGTYALVVIHEDNRKQLYGVNLK